MDSRVSGVTREVIHGKVLYRKNLSRTHHNEDIRVARWENDSWDSQGAVQGTERDRGGLSINAHFTLPASP